VILVPYHRNYYNNLKMCSESCKTFSFRKVLLILFSPIILVLVTVWSFLHVVATITPKVTLSIFTFTFTAVFFFSWCQCDFSKLAPESKDSIFLPWLIFAIYLMVLPIIHEYLSTQYNSVKCYLGYFLSIALPTSFSIVSFSTFNTTQSMVNLAIGQSVGVILCGFSCSNLWHRTSRIRLIEEQNKWVEKHNPNLSFKTSVIGELGTLQVPPSPLKSRKNILLCHGAGQGNAGYLNVLSNLSKEYNLHCVEWLGWGTSLRPHGSFNYDYFVNGIEKWRVASNIEGKFILVGHSMGSMLMCQYALEYPQHVEQLILCSVCGMVRAPPIVQQPNSWWVNSQIVWHYFFKPVSWFKIMGPFTRMMMYKYIQRRFAWANNKSGIHDLDKASLVEYHTQLLCQYPNRGENAINLMLGPRAYPSGIPLGEKMVGKNYDNLHTSLLEYSFPLSFVYGSNDWMDPSHAERVMWAMRDVGKVNVNLEILPNLGHLLYMEDPQAFAEALKKCIKMYQN
jgi:pimeloyl-ACP methyl ester carboxylesterase